MLNTIHQICYTYGKLEVTKMMIKGRKSKYIHYKKNHEGTKKETMIEKAFPPQLRTGMPKLVG
jgi:hypothetical protein